MTLITDVLLKKSQVIESFQDFPEDVTSEALIERILFIKSVMGGIEQANNGQMTPNEEFMRELKEWKNAK